MKILGKKVHPQSKPHHRKSKFWTAFRKGLDESEEVMGIQLGSDNEPTIHQILDSADPRTGRPCLPENPTIRGYKI